MRAFGSVTLAGLFIAAALMVASPAFAQQAQQNGVGFGVEAGITRATIHADNAGNLLKSRTGVMAGIWFGGNRNGRVGFMGEITYVVKGVNDEARNPPDELKLHYLEIPALFRVNIGQTGRNGFTVYPLFGPVVDIKLKSAINGVKIDEQFSGYDFGVMGGVGVEWARIGVEVRGNWGLRSLTTGSNYNGLQKTKNRTIQILAKFRIS
jgi:hypothetical protein